MEWILFPKGFFKAVLRLATNPSYVLLNLSTVCALYVVVGVLIQLPRYLEVQFRQPAYMANIIAGILIRGNYHLNLKSYKFN